MVPRVPTAPPPTSQPPPRDPSANSKTSIAHSSSHEADDERTPSEASSMGPDADAEDRVARLYPDEDARLTSKKELSGFYVYGWAAEVFVVCGVGSFIPITLEQLARERGVLLSDKSTPCGSSFDAPVPPNMNHTSIAANATSALLSRTSYDADAGQCVVNILGLDVNTASFAMYTFSLSVLIQALLIISMSGAADHGRYRKTFLLAFAFIGSITTMLFLPIVPRVYILGAVLAIIANTCFGASFVLLNSFLPLLVRHHPTVQYAVQHPPAPEDGDRHQSPVDEDTMLDDITDSTAALLGGGSGADLTSPTRQSPAAPSRELQLSTKISSYGIGIGYVAAVIVQALSIFIIISTGSSTFSLRLALFVIGAWWFVFTIPAAFWLRPRPGPPLSISHANSKARTCFAYFSYSWKALGKTIRHARQLKDMLLFLGAWFLLSDGIATISGTAVLFAKTSLEMKPAALAFINVISMLSGVVGAFTWSRLSAMMGLKPTQTILACICLFELIPLYGLLGYIPAVRRYGAFGLQQPWEMYPLGAVYGFVLGGLSSYCRSLFGELIPPGSEAAFYALYAITDKGSSIFGPAIVGAITDATGEIRPAFWFLAVLVGLPFPLMLMVNVERGRADGIAMSKELNDGKSTGVQRDRARSSDSERSVEDEALDSDSGIIRGSHDGR
ncbi:hypothetical protein W97_04407 [Coniosporium apollinis CBS 100218]|uniref:Autophagy-related protein n=1 Tax=Coniosporium apollinis (strain CBS 100218) TaxID=1168221 RepID=R7YTF7_CONA1|nr:uncharacterized protein W97_04407 [Coniosporium apollinis CBS 100218]EON65170.1 hypothetical protein W97_04407 [Coniosporium apollinis CBS 100218]